MNDQTRHMKKLKKRKAKLKRRQNFVPRVGQEQPSYGDNLFFAGYNLAPDRLKEDKWFT